MPQGAPPAPPAPVAPVGFAPPAPAPAPAFAPAPASAPAPFDAAAALDVTAPLGAPVAGPFDAAAAAAPTYDPMPQYTSETISPMPELEPAGAVAVDAEAAAEPGELPAWASLGTALVLAMAALAWQFVSYYASEQLPVVQASGAVLTYFDQIVAALPLASSSFGMVFGSLLGCIALGMVLLGARRGVREPVLQLAVGGIAGSAIAATVLLPMVAG
jgi:hypothetical protein